MPVPDANELGTIAFQLFFMAAGLFAGIRVIDDVKHLIEARQEEPQDA